MDIFRRKGSSDFVGGALTYLDQKLSRSVPTSFVPTPCRTGEDGLEVAFEDSTSVLKVLLGVGFGGGDALKRFVEYADDPLLFGERRKHQCKIGQSRS